MKKVTQKYHADEYPMGGIYIKQPLPHQGLEQIDPFLLLHHAKINFPGNEHPRDKGVPPHPHVGFAPVTLIFQGGVHHRDTMGNSSVIPAGGVQWMNSGKGVIHSERPPKELAEKGGTQEIIQLWINVPSIHKRENPDYQGLKPEDFPKVWQKDESYLDLIIGNQNGKTGPAKSYTDMLAFKGEVFEESNLELEIPSGYNTFIYVLSGEIIIGNDAIKGEYLGLLDNESSDLIFKVLPNTKFIIMSGKPINEKLVTYGPFVMNSQKEIMEANNDYMQGKMGQLVEEF